MIRAISIPLSLHLLGPETYGVWVVLANLSSLFLITDLGIGQAAIQRLVILDATRAKNDFRLTVQALLVVYALLAAVCALISVITINNGWIFQWFSTSTSLANTVQGPVMQALVLVSCATSLQVLAKPAMALHEAMLTSHISYYISFGSSVVTLTVLAWHSTESMGLVNYCAAMTIPPVIGALALYLSIFVKIPGVLDLKSNDLIGEVRRLSGNSARFLLIQLSDYCIYYLPVILIADRVSVSAAAEYSVTAAVLMFFVNVLCGFGQPNTILYLKAVAGGRGIEAVRRQGRVLALSSLSYVVYSIFIGLAWNPILSKVTRSQIAVSSDVMFAQIGFFGLLMVSQQNGFFLIGLGRSGRKMFLQILNTIVIIVALGCVREKVDLAAGILIGCLPLVIDAAVGILTLYREWRQATVRPPAVLA